MHARNLAQHKSVDQVLLVGRDSDRLKIASAKVADQLATDAEKAKLSSTLDLDAAIVESDGVLIASSSASHPELVRKCIAHSRTTLVEKPLALELNELESLANEIEKSGTEVMVAFHRKYDPHFQALRQKVASGEVGTVRLVRSTALDHNGLNLDYIGSSGGVWRDMLIHDFDLIPWVLGEKVISVQAFGAVLDEPTYAKFGDADTAVAVLEFESGAIATVAGTRRNGAGQDVRLEIYGTKNTFSVGFDSHAPVTSIESDGFHPQGIYEDFMDRFEPTFKAEVDHFIKLIKGQAQNLTSARDGLTSLRIAIAAEESRKSRMPVLL